MLKTKPTFPRGTFKKHIQHIGNKFAAGKKPSSARDALPAMKPRLHLKVRREAGTATGKAERNSSWDPARVERLHGDRQETAMATEEREGTAAGKDGGLESSSTISSLICTSSPLSPTLFFKKKAFFFKLESQVRSFSWPIASSSSLFMFSRTFLSLPVQSRFSFPSFLTRILGTKRSHAAPSLAGLEIKFCISKRLFVINDREFQQCEPFPT